MSRTSNAQTILRVGRRLGATPKSLLAALEAGLVETNLRNLPYGDADSQGVFQQRPSQGWTGLTNLPRAAEEFFQHAIPLARKYGTAGELAQAVQRSAYPGRYGGKRDEALAFLHGQSASGPGQNAPRSVSVTVPQQGGLPGFDPGTVQDQSGLLAQLLQSQQQPAPTPSVPDPGFQKYLPQAGQAPQFSLQPQQRDVSGLLSLMRGQGQELPETPASTGPGASVTVTGTTGRGGGSGRPAAPTGGKVIVAAGADRAGVGVQPIVKDYVKAVSAHNGRPITITTGTNHNQFVVGTHRQSDHWDGHGADIGVPIDSQRGDLIAAHALQEAGVPWGRAIKMAQQGGLFTLTPGSGRFKGHRVQVIWKTYEGGNHHNHIHIGIR